MPLSSLGTPAQQNFTAAIVVTKTMHTLDQILKRLSPFGVTKANLYGKNPRMVKYFAAGKLLPLGSKLLFRAKFFGVAGPAP